MKELMDSGIAALLLSVSCSPVQCGFVQGLLINTDD